MQEEDNVIRAVSGNTITLAAPLIYGHLGTFPRQAAVGNLTRNVIVSSLTPDARRETKPSGSSPSAFCALRDSSSYGGGSRSGHTSTS